MNRFSPIRHAYVTAPGAWGGHEEQAVDYRLVYTAPSAGTALVVVAYLECLMNAPARLFADGADALSLAQDLTAVVDDAESQLVALLSPCLREIQWRPAADATGSDSEDWRDCLFDGRPWQTLSQDDRAAVLHARRALVLLPLADRIGRSAGDIALGK